MIKSILTAVLALGLSTSTTVLGQQHPPLQPAATSPGPSFTKFDLDFPGGTPADLVAAIEKATGKPLNAIIPPEHANVQLPPLKMRHVTAPKLFESLEASSVHQVRYETGSRFGPSSYQIANIAYGFRKADGGNDGDDTIWHFFVQGQIEPPPQPRVCRYFQLEPYLHAYSVDDITTAIQTGWRMLGDKDAPQLSFHKETRLLIAVGDPGELNLIDQVLSQLQPKPQLPAPNPVARPTTTPRVEKSK